MSKSEVNQGAAQAKHAHGASLADTLGDATKLPADAAAKLQKNATLAAVVGLACTGAAFAIDKHRFGYSYLVGFAFVATIGLGALFFVMLHHLTRAGWSVTARRHMEFVAEGILPWVVLLFAPIAVLAHDIFHSWMGEHVAEAIEKKHAYLNPQFFFIRAAGFFAIWALLAIWFAKRSRDQDVKPNDVGLTRKMQAVSAPAMFAFAYSLTFAAFDWLMSLDAHWFSTIFGVYIFSGAVTSSLSVLALITMALQKNGWLKKSSTVEHRHDIGKLMFAFTIFWTYIAFSQYFLIWYANIPEETAWYKLRWEGPWMWVSLALIFMQFVIPFWVLLSRHTKRSYTGLTAGAVILLVAHYIDLYWLVMPTLGDAGAMPSIVDLLALLGPLGVGVFLVARVLVKGPLFPVGDPRLLESMKLENL